MLQAEIPDTTRNEMPQDSRSIIRRLVRLSAQLGTDNGQGMVEYGLLLALVGVAVASAAFALSGQLSAVIDTVTTSLQSAGL
jgi:Flp pilus assembly pilin Flp